MLYMFKCLIPFWLFVLLSLRSGTDVSNRSPSNSFFYPAVRYLTLYKLSLKMNTDTILQEYVAKLKISDILLTGYVKCDGNFCESI